MCYQTTRTIKMKLGCLILFIAALCGCSCGTAPQFVRRDLEEASFEYHQKDGIQREVQWKDVAQQDQEQILKWLADSPMNGRRCFTTYVPVVVVRAKKFNVNFTGNLAVCNYESDSGGWRQTSRTMSDADEKVRECIMRTVQGSPLTTSPLH